MQCFVIAMEIPGGAMAATGGRQRGEAAAAPADPTVGRALGLVARDAIRTAAI